MSIARLLSKFGALLNSSGQVSTTGLQDDSVTNAKRTQGVQVFTSVGTSTFTVPSGVSKVKVTVVGGGGGGSYNLPTTGSNGGSGGGAGLSSGSGGSGIVIIRYPS